MDASIVKTAVSLHGHLSPGIALGLRMSEISLQRINMKKGSKTLIAISETSRCLPDAIQVATGCTLGHSSIILVNYGKLALSVIDTTTKQGIRITLNENAKEHSTLLNKWMTRNGKLTKEEEQDLSKKVLEMSEEFFLVQKIHLGKLKLQPFESGKIAACSKCKETFPLELSVNKKEIICQSCSSGANYTQ